MIQYYLDLYKTWVHEPNGQPDQTIGPFDGPIRLDYDGQLLDGAKYHVYGANAIAEIGVSGSVSGSVRVIQSMPMADEPIQYTDEAYQLCLMRAVFVEKVP